MRIRKARKTLRKLYGHDYSEKAPGYRFSTAWKALNTWGQRRNRNPSKTPDSV